MGSVVSMQVGTGNNPTKAPFTKALAKADKLLVVRNENEDLFERIWCCWELFMAYECGLIHRPGALMVCGPSTIDWTGQVLPDVDIATARSSNPEDKRQILMHVMSQESQYRNINEELTEIRRFNSESQVLDEEVVEAQPTLATTN